MTSGRRRANHAFGDFDRRGLSNIGRRMNAEADQALVVPEARRNLDSNGPLPAGGTPEHPADLIRTRSAVSAKVLRQATTKD